MTKLPKHFPEQSDTGSILNAIPETRMGEFVDRLLQAVPPQQPMSGSAVSKRVEPEIETEADGKRAGELRRLKALRGYRVHRVQT